jgi:hypothetical protein
MVGYFGKYIIGDYSWYIVPHFKALPLNARNISERILKQHGFVDPLSNPKFYHIILTSKNTQLICYCPIQESYTNDDRPRWSFYGIYSQSILFGF